MANNFSGRCYTIDTVMPAPIKDQVKVTGITWTNQVAAGDSLVIVDKAGNIIFSAKAAGANDSQLMQLDCFWMNGFQVTVLTSGLVTLFLK